MPKKRRMLNTSTSDLYYSPDKKTKDVKNHDEVWMARGRLKGALMEALDPNPDGDSSSNEESPVKIEKNAGSNDGKVVSSVKKEYNDLSDGDEYASDVSDKRRSIRKKILTPNRSNSYVMKLFDRSVDLAQFKEDTPLYPICRAWMANQPRNTSRPTVREKTPDADGENSLKVELPPPEGPLIPRVPPLLPEQLEYGNHHIQFNYNEVPPPSIDALLDMHKVRWSAIRRNWFEQSIKYEARYAKTQAILKEMDTNS